jgi:hypothetical protein
MKSLSSRKRSLLAASLTTAIALATGPAFAAGQLNDDADQILRAMSTHLAGLKAFSVSADIGTEIVSDEGMKLQFNARSELLIQRPSSFHAVRQGRFVDAVMNYDGKQLSVFGKNLNAYAQVDMEGSIDDAIRELEQRTGMSMPGADLLLTDSYSALMSGVINSGYYGRSFIGGVEAHHLGFRTPKVDFQIWVSTGDEPLPLKYVITTKWMTGAPQYSVQLSNWNTKPVISKTSFQFAPPEGADRLEVLPVDETGELIDNSGSNP